MLNNSENLDKKTELGKQSNIENKDKLKESFSNLKNELEKLKNQVKEGKEKKEDINKIQKIEEKIKNIDDEINAIDSQIKIEKKIEKETGLDGNLTPKQERTLATNINKISQRLKENPGEANQGRAESGLKILKDIYNPLDTNPIANSMQKIIRFILSLGK